MPPPSFQVNLEAGQRLLVWSTIVSGPVGGQVTFVDHTRGGAIIDVTTSVRQGSDRGLLLARAAARVAEEHRGRDVVILDMRNQTTEFDFFVIATGSSRRQLHAISEEIDNCLQGEWGDRRLSIEGYQTGEWILLDYGDVVVHLFDNEHREFYDLEHLWGGAVEIPLSEEFEPPAAD